MLLQSPSVVITCEDNRCVMKTIIAFCFCFCVLISYALSYNEDDLIADDLLQGDYEGLDKRDSSDVDRRAVRYDKLSRFLRINNRGKKIKRNGNYYSLQALLL
ncbi:Hypothetical predicted protein [Octopus vulgaris]|uniref:Uncharacterized protein n=1 Tax=Octopus vulgaris TaxID=6645 RepID=A0AA36FH01_OCTVU|nr:Hypothetical predicted protein [Octopus vulgaris]